ncbi:MAG: hypothetical protein M1830_000974 [Pleopsidium flavum]|nr:MAG: hypothetical protein M1830_000974 [Pleopsidium flavum]
MTSSGWPFPDAEPLRDEPQAAFVKDAETGNEIGRKSLHSDHYTLPHVELGIPIAAAINADHFPTTKQESHLLLPSLDSLNEQTISNKTLANSTPDKGKNRDLEVIDSEDEFADDEAEIFNDLDEEALKKLPPGLRNTMQAMQNDKRKRMHRKTGIFPDGGLRIPEAFSSSGEAESAKSTTSASAVGGRAAEMMSRFVGEHESEEEGEPERVLRVTNPDIQQSDSSGAGKAKKENGKSKEVEDKSNNHEDEANATSSDETSLWLRVIDGTESSEGQATSQEENDDHHLYTHDAGFPDSFRANSEDRMFGGAGPSAVITSQEGTFADSYMDRMRARNRGELTPSTALGSNPVTADDLAFIESINQKKKIAREAVEKAEKEKFKKGNPLTSTVNRKRNSDIVPMRQWKEDARLAGMPTSPDSPKHHLPYEGFPVTSQTSSPSDSKGSKASGHSIKDNISRPFKAIGKQAHQGMAYVKGVLHGKGKSDRRQHSLRPDSRARDHDDLRGGMKIGPSYKTKPSGRRNPAAPDKGPRTDINITYRGEVEDYTI